MILFLTIKKEFFDLIVLGIKKEEYRDIKPFFDKRLFSKDYKTVLFQNGYEITSPRVEVELLSIEKKYANPEWAAGYSGYCYALKLGKILKHQQNGKEKSES